MGIARPRIRHAEFQDFTRRRVETAKRIRSLSRVPDRAVWRYSGIVRRCRSSPLRRVISALITCAPTLTVTCRNLVLLSGALSQALRRLARMLGCPLGVRVIAIDDTAYALTQSIAADREPRRRPVIRPSAEKCYATRARRTHMKKSRGGRMTAAKTRAAKRKGGKGPVSKRKAGRKIMKT